MRNSFRAYCTALVLMMACTMAASFAWAATPVREQGLSMHMMPKRVADLQGRKWGFIVAYATYLQPEKRQPVLQSAEEVWEFVHKQDHTVQQNGIWIVVTHPDAYSASEHALLEAVKAMCRQKKIPLFIARAAQLPHGWQRYDNLPSTNFNF